MLRGKEHSGEIRFENQMPSLEGKLMQKAADIYPCIREEAVGSSEPIAKFPERFLSFFFRRHIAPEPQCIFSAVFHGFISSAFRAVFISIEDGHVVAAFGT